MTRPGPQGAAIRAEKLLAVLSDCAAQGRAAPTNAELMDILGLERENSASRTLKRLEERGVVTVQRFTNSRVITITSTGKSTAGAAGTAHWTDENAAAGADDQPQGDAAPVARAKPEPLRLDRDPCTFCGVRADVGCRHSRAALRLASVPVFRHFSEVARG